MLSELERARFQMKALAAGISPVQRTVCPSSGLCASKLRLSARRIPAVTLLAYSLTSGFLLICHPAPKQVCLDCDPDAPSYALPACRVLGQYGLQTTASKLSSPAVQAVLAKLRGEWGSGEVSRGPGMLAGRGQLM